MTQHTPLRADVKAFVLSCERLIAAVHDNPNCETFADEEIWLIGNYAGELAELFKLLRERSPQALGPAT